jgi:uncharacterized membrane protein
MLYATLKTLHLLTIIVWIGGMVFAHFFLRPAAAALQPADRVRLMHGVLGRFFAAVLGLSVLALVTGIWMIGAMAKQVAQSGGHFAMPLAWTVMGTLGIVMFLIFGHIRFVLYKRLSLAVQASDWTAGTAALAPLRGWVAVNLGLGVLIVLITLIGIPR